MNKTYGTLGTPAICILLALVGQERHGYAIMKEVARLSNDNVKLGPATLYTNIKRLLENGLIKEVGERTDPDALRREERRRYYALTSLGQTAVNQEIEQMEILVKQFRTGSLAI